MRVQAVQPARPAAFLRLALRSLRRSFASGVLPRVPLQARLFPAGPSLPHLFAGRLLLPCLLVACLAAFPASLQAQHGSGGQQPHFASPRPALQRPASQPPASQQPSPAPGGNGAPRFAPGGTHLPQWLQNHQTLNPQQKEQALRQEPGFSHLPEPQQQHLIDRLHKLDSAPPEVRQRILARNEIFERMAPEQKQEIRGASQALSQMPPERNQAVRHAFRDLRGLPPEQRQAVLNSARFQAEYSPQERTVLGHLLSIEPYQP